MKKAACIIFVCLLSACSNLLFYPEEEHLFTPERFGLTYENVFLETPDNVRLHAWFIPAYAERKELLPAKGTILLVHGNAENISTHTFGAVWLVFEGYNLMALDYRGFGLSNGSVSLSGAEKDINTALKYLTENDPHNLFVLGQSIGGSLTVSTISKSPYQNKVSGIIIDSAFSSTRKIAREKVGQLWFLWPFQYPLSFLVSENNAAGKVSKIKPPKLFITTQTDEVVPAHHTRILYDKAVQPKEIKILPVGRHITALNNKEMREYILNFLQKNSYPKLNCTGVSSE